MFIFVSGGVRSGKSAWAEECATHLDRSLSAGPLVYLATARVFDEEMRERVKLHQLRREQKGFLTVERQRNLCDIVPQIPAKATVLLECLGTWTANELFDDEGRVSDLDTVSQKIYADVSALRERAAHLLIVSNDIFSDGATYGKETEGYRSILGALHVRLAAVADVAVECVAGCPAVHRGAEKLIFRKRA